MASSVTATVARNGFRKVIEDLPTCAGAIGGLGGPRSRVHIPPARVLHLGHLGAALSVMHRRSGVLHEMSGYVSALVGQETLLASWRALARTSRGARLLQTPGVAAAVFPAWEPLNNAILLDRPDETTASAAAAQLSGAYAEAGVGAWALWVPSTATDLEAPDRVRAVVGLKRDTTTLVMHAALGPGLPTSPDVVRTSVADASRATDEPVGAADSRRPSGWMAWRLGCWCTTAWRSRARGA